MAQGVLGSAPRRATASSSRSSASSTGSAESIPTRSSAGPSTRSRCSRSASSASILLYAMQRLQTSLPFNPTNAPQVGEALSFNTATSFVTNTNWQSYYPESTVSNFTQMVGLDGAELRLGRRGHGGDGRAHPRTRAGARSDTIGNFWVDLTRTTLRILLPISFVGAFIYVGTGVVQNFERLRGRQDARGQHPGDPGRAGGQPGGHQDARHQRRRVLQRQRGAPALEPERLLEPARDLPDPGDPVRAHLDLREDGRRPAARAWCSSRSWSRSGRSSSGSTTLFELNGNPKLDAPKRRPVDVTSTNPAATSRARRCASARRPPRLWAASTTGTSNGSVNSMHDSYTPLGGMMPPAPHAAR